MAVISNVERLATYDGPGLRTVLYFKGCPLCCSWCANPETQKVKPQVMVNHGSCILCQRCIDTCPKQAITLVEGKIIIDEQECDGCSECTHNCPSASLHLCGQELNTDEMFELCTRDQTYYHKSGGGVTASGGEVLLYSKEVVALFSKLQKEGINTAFESSGYGNHENFKKLLAVTDYPIIDYKLPAKLHKLYTGKDNSKIIENIKTAVDSSEQLLIRIPIVPNINDDIHYVDEIANELYDLGVKQVELLKYHSLGKSKYEELNREYTISGNVSDKQFEQYKMIFRLYNINVL